MDYQLEIKQIVGEWICKTSEPTEWFRTRFQHQALSILVFRSLSTSSILSSPASSVSSASKQNRSTAVAKNPVSH